MISLRIMYLFCKRLDRHSGPSDNFDQGSDSVNSSWNLEKNKSLPNDRHENSSKITTCKKTKFWDLGRIMADLPTDPDCLLPPPKSIVSVPTSATDAAPGAIISGDCAAVRIFRCHETFNQFS